MLLNVLVVLEPWTLISDDEFSSAKGLFAGPRGPDGPSCDGPLSLQLSLLHRVTR